MRRSTEHPHRSFLFVFTKTSYFPLSTHSEVPGDALSNVLLVSTRLRTFERTSQSCMDKKEIVEQRLHFVHS